eukprot:1579622-Rhodomonas_salina.1
MHLRGGRGSRVESHGRGSKEAREAEVGSRDKTGKCSGVEGRDREGLQAESRLGVRNCCLLYTSDAADDM